MLLAGSCIDPSPGMYPPVVRVVEDYDNTCEKCQEYPGILRTFELSRPACRPCTERGLSGRAGDVEVSGGE